MSELRMNPDWESHLVKPAADLERHIGEEVLADMKALCPVETGALKASLELTQTPEGTRIGSHLDYFVYVTMGTRNMAPEPFAQAALYRKRDR